MSILVTILALLCVAQPPQRGARDYERIQVLSESVTGKRPATDAEVQQLLIEALRDPDPFIRSQGAELSATIIMFSAAAHVPEQLQWAVRRAGLAETLRAELEKAIHDADSRVRREAWRAIVGAALYAKPGAPLPAATVRALAAHFEKFSDTTDRSFVITAVQTSFRSEDAEVRALSLELLKKALEGQDAYLVQTAGHVAAKSQAPEILPLMVAQLKNPSYVARMGVAQGIASYGAAARPYLQQLQAALEAETHDITRKTIAGTISVIQR